MRKFLLHEWCEGVSMTAPLAMDLGGANVDNCDGYAAVSLSNECVAKLSAF